MDDRELFQRLITAEEESEVERILDAAGYGLRNESAWRPLGDMENNFVQWPHRFRREKGCR
jgi:hypothetical protein